MEGQIIEDAEFREVDEKSKKECICQSCSHFDVCKYSEMLTEVNEHLSEISLEFPDFIKIQLVCEKSNESKKEQVIMYNNILPSPTYPTYNPLANTATMPSLLAQTQQCCNTVIGHDYHFGM